MNKFYVSEDIAEKLQAKGYPHSHIIHFDNGIPIARIDEVLDWLREKDIQVAPWYHRIKKQWSCTVSYNNGEYNTILYNDYTDAAMGGIKYVIDNLI